MPSTTSPLRVSRTQRFGLVAAACAFAVPWLVTFDGLSEAGHRILAVFLLAVVLWVTEAIPLHATAALVILLEVALVSDQAVVPLPDGPAAGYDEFLATLAHPVIILFLGGFFLADGAAKFDLDRNIARVMLRPFGTRPTAILFGVMLITAVLSMFMSNTATTATMIAVLLPVISGLDPSDRMRVGLALSIPVAANVGGIGTPVGTPPNAIALGALNEIGIRLTFVEWMAATVPFVAVVLVFAWYVLGRLYPAATEHVVLRIDATLDTSRPAKIFYATAAVTLALWLTEPLHGINSNAVGFLPVAVLLATRVFDADDLKNIQWHVLWLVAGGIALGNGVAATGLDAWIVSTVDWAAVPATLIVAAMALLAIGLSTVISNSATANLLIPIGITLALSPAVAVDPLLAAILISVACSLAMALPISTPPNAVAYSTGVVTTRDLAVTGAVVGGVGLALFAFVGPWFWRLIGIVPGGPP